jgi:LysM domain-containing protein
MSRVHGVAAGMLAASVIAERFGLNWHTIAAENGVAGPEYVIYTGQRLSL